MLLHIFHLQDFCTLPHVFAHLSITRASQAQKLLDLGSIWYLYLVAIVLQSQVWALSCLVHKSVSQPDILLTNQTMLNLESKVITVFSKLLHALVKVINTHLSKLLYVFVKVVSVADFPSCQTEASQSFKYFFEVYCHWVFCFFFWTEVPLVVEDATFATSCVQQFTPGSKSCLSCKCWQDCVWWWNLSLNKWLSGNTQSSWSTWVRCAFCNVYR